MSKQNKLSNRRTPKLSTRVLVREGLDDFADQPKAPKRARRKAAVDLRTKTRWVDDNGWDHYTDPRFEAFADRRTHEMLELGKLFGKSTAEIVHLLIKEDEWRKHYPDDRDVSDAGDVPEEESELYPFEDERAFFQRHDTLFYHLYHPTVLPGHRFGE